MQLIMPTLLFIGLTNIMGIQVLVPLGKEKIVLYSEIAGAIIDLIINMLLIPKIASAGAAIGTVVAELAVFVVQFYFLSKMNVIDIKAAFSGISYWKIILGVLLASAASFWVKLIDLSALKNMIMLRNFILLAISAVLFFGVYLVIMLATKDDLTKDIVESVLNKVLKKEKSENK